MAGYRRARRAATRTMTLAQAAYCAWKVAHGRTCTKAEMAAALTSIWWGIGAVRSKKK